MASPSPHLVFSTAHELQQQLADGKITSVELVDLFLHQIKRHNHEGLKVNAVLAVMPREVAIERARMLDQERQEGRVWSVLHGIPIIIKDAIVTDQSLGMPTTVGAHAFATLKAKANAKLVDQLIDAGIIVFAKATLTEFCGLKSNNTPMGWSAYGGQTLSAYRTEGLDEKDQPFSAGSSSGTAVGIITGFSPIGIGTETTGSIVYPASASGLYGMRISSRSVSLDGVFSLSKSFDSVGGMARDPADLAALTEVLLTEEARSRVSESGYEKAMGEGWEGMGVGVLSSTWGVDESIVKGKWDLPSVVDVYESAVKTMESHGCRIVYPLQCADADTLKYEDLDLTKLAYHEFPAQVEKFVNNFEHDADMTNLQDIIAWNVKHKEKAMPEPYTTQTELIKAANSSNNITLEVHATAVRELHRLAGCDGMSKVMDEHGLDVVLSASESRLVTYAGCAGWPIATVPLGNLEKNGQPIGMFAIARARREDVLLRFMAGWHATFKGAEPPVVPV